MARALGFTITCLMCSTTGFAFVPPLDGPTERPPMAPPAGVGLATPPLAKMLSQGRSLWRDDGSFAFLGRVPLAATSQPFNRGAVALEQWAVHAARRYFLDLIDGDLPEEALRPLGVVRAGERTVVTLGQYVGDQVLENVRALAVLSADAVIYARHNLVPPPALASHARLSPSQAASTAREHMARLGSMVHPRDTITPVAVYAMGRWHRAWRVEVVGQRAAEVWALFISAQTGDVVASKRLISHATQGVVRFNVEPRCEGETPVRVEMPHIHWANDQYTDEAGEFSATGSVANAEVTFASEFVKLVDRAATLGRWQFPLQPTPAHNTIEVTDPDFAQADAFYHVHNVRAWVRRNVPAGSSQHTWSDRQIPVNININDTCNAYYNSLDGSINFYRSGGPCLNTGRAASIVYHEYGHALHDNSSNGLDGQVSEGISDYVAATINDDPEMTGMFSCTSSLRTCVNDLTYCWSGCDLSPSSQVHDAAPVMCAVLWELRTYLIDRYGKAQGVRTADALFLRFLAQVGNMNSAYDAMIAADEDTDGDPHNGTLHSCEINRAFASDRPGETAHFPSLTGLVPKLPVAIIDHGAPGAMPPGDSPSLNLVGPSPPTLTFDVASDAGCSESTEAPTAAFFYRIDGGPEQEMTLTAMDQGSDNYRFAAELTDVQPPAEISYYLRVELAGEEYLYPPQSGDANTVPGWPRYKQEAFVGDYEEVFSSDLEADTSGFVTRAEDEDSNDAGESDWQLGTPDGADGGPSAAHSGNSVWGTNLAGDYSADKRSALELPVLDLQNYEIVRLQFWRHLQLRDTARVEVNGETVFNRDAGMKKWHDPLWIFDDIDISEQGAGQEQLQIRFVMDDTASKNGQAAGFYLDDIRVVAKAKDPIAPAGDGPELEAMRGFTACSGTGQSGDGWWIWLALVGLVRLPAAARRQGR